MLSNESIAPTHSLMQPEAPLPPAGGVAYAWAKLRQALRDQPAVRGIATILSNVDRVNEGLPICDLLDRDLKDALRFFGLAKGLINSLDPDVMDDATEQLAQLICDGNGEYSSLETQHPMVQAKYRRLAQSAINRLQAALEGNRGL